MELLAWVTNLPSMQETSVRSLGWKDPLEKGMAIHSSILAWRIPWTEEPSRLQFIGSRRVRHNWASNIFTFMIHMKMYTFWEPDRLFKIMYYCIECSEKGKILATGLVRWKAATWTQALILLSHACFPVTIKKAFHHTWEAIHQPAPPNFLFWMSV